MPTSNLEPVSLAVLYVALLFILQVSLLNRFSANLLKQFGEFNIGEHSQ